ncbi:MAG: hypothetical protein KatS3mg088_392 [Patescibacteria group bacterium]|nr:MAG: hypothetical protein KatS3mg088_392 [Patescibacteria group bacterium]
MFLIINKPVGVTSHDVVDRIRKITGEKRVGHSGTLDPFASGLLILAVGRVSTKKISKFVGLDKEYEAEITLGEERTTDDLTGDLRKDGIVSSRVPSEQEIISVLKSFVGKIKQVPPYFSAIKKEGKKFYELARKGQFISPEARDVVIYSIKLLDYQYPKLKIVCKVSSGTYIRALARDIGRKLKTGAYLSSLKRISIGNFKIDNAVDLEKINSENWRSFVKENL